MITIPTSDLTGLLSDVIPFGHIAPELPELHCVRLEWDGVAMHALTTDRYRVGWCTWRPGDIPPGEEAQDDLFTEWGGADNSWACTIALPEAAEIVKVFKLPAKEGRIPLTVDYEADRRRLTVKRARDTGYSAITFAAEDTFAAFPDVRALLSKSDALTSVRERTYTAKYLADFAKVRAHGPLELRFTKGLTHVAIGDRFVGAIMPSKVEK